MNRGHQGTKDYDVKVRKSGKRKGQGKLRVTYYFLIPDLFRLLPYTYLCTGSTTFTAKPR